MVGFYITEDLGFSNACQKYAGDNHVQFYKAHISAIFSSFNITKCLKRVYGQP